MSFHPPYAVLERDAALFLDIDGTLLDFSPSPESVIVPPGLPECLARLQQRLGGALALVSGRSLADIDRLFGPGFAAAAEHGALLRGADGALLARHQPDPALAEIAPSLRQAVAARPGTLLEEKDFGLALHWRAAPEHGEALTALGEKLAVPHSGLVLLPAKQALEIRSRGPDKGEALAAFMARPPFRGRRPVFIGDDVTDEPAIERARELGGAGLHVAHDFRGEPEAVRQWLASHLKEGAL